MEDVLFPYSRVASPVAFRRGNLFFAALRGCVLGERWKVAFFSPVFS